MTSSWPLFVRLASLVSELRGLLRLLALLRDEELGVVRTLRRRVVHLLLVVLLGLLLVALRLGQVLLDVADHVVHHPDDAGARLALLVLTKGLWRRPWLRGAEGDLGE